MEQDFIINGQAHGSVANRLIQSKFAANSMRPYIGKDGRSYISINRDGRMIGVPVHNANATLLKQEWQHLDQAVVAAAVPRLRAVADLRGRGLQYVMPNGMAHSVLQSQAQSEITGASISMDGLAEGQGDRPVYNLNNLPLPIIHKDFSFSARQLAISRQGNMPLDTTTAKLAAKRVAEACEQLLIGTAPSYTYGGGSIYGYTNFPGRMTKTLSSPLLSAWTPRLTLLDVLAMRSQAQAQFHFGPYVLYVSTAWDRYMDDDLSTYKGEGTLRDRLRKIDGIEDVVTLDYLVGYDALLVQMSEEVTREVIGMEIQTVQWESHGGMQLNFKVMGILVPQIRADFNGNTGIVHGAVSGQTTAFAAVNITANNP